MNLDDSQAFSQLDSENVLAEIESMPDQLRTAWDQGQPLDLPAWTGIKQVVIAAMGTSALAADLLQAYAAPFCPLPVLVLRDYGLPVWASGPETLVICLSYTGYTEEVLSVFEQALAHGCQVLAITQGGYLAAAAQESKAVLWNFEHSSQFYAAVGYSFALLLAAFTRLGWIPDPTIELEAAIAAMKAQQATLVATVPVMQNEAKRLAGQSMGRRVTIFGSDHLVPVARYWKMQLNLLAKAGAQFETLPEADHNTLVGVINPKAMIGQTMLLFLRSRGCHPRNQLRTEITKEHFMLEALGTDFFNAAGDTVLTQMWTALHFGDYLAYYLAMAYGVDPNPVGPIEELKVRLLETE